MSTRIKGFAVTLDRDYRDDDAESVRQAIAMVKGVLTVEPVESNIDDLMNRTRVRFELEQQIFDVLRKQ